LSPCLCDLVQGLEYWRESKRPAAVTGNNQSCVSYGGYVMNTFPRLRKHSVILPLVLALSSLLVACGGSESTGPATGTASLDVTDAPADDVTAVKLTISAVSLKPENGDAQYIEFEEPVIIENLLALQEGNIAALLPDTRFPAGRYNW